MTKVFLHGALGKAVGREEWNLDVRGAAEALRAIEANTGKLFSYLTNHEGGQAMYQVVFDNGRSPGSIPEVSAPIPRKEIHFVPVLAGAGSGDILMIIGIALVLIAVTVFSLGAGGVLAGTALGGTGAFGLSATAAWASTLVLSMGISLTLAGVASALTPTPKTNNPHPSYLFSGVANTTAQGNPVPVGYGELMVGSATISAGVTAKEMPIHPGQPT